MRQTAYDSCAPRRPHNRERRATGCHVGAMSTQPVLRTDRLILRPFTFDDAVAVQLIRKHGRFEDLAVYAILAGEWAARRQP
jgi:hypothetical protein